MGEAEHGSNASSPDEPESELEPVEVESEEESDDEESGPVLAELVSPTGSASGSDGPQPSVIHGASKAGPEAPSRAQSAQGEQSPARLGALGREGRLLTA